MQSGTKTTVKLDLGMMVATRANANRTGISVGAEMS